MTGRKAGSGNWVIVAAMLAPWVGIALQKVRALSEPSPQKPWAAFWWCRWVMLQADYQGSNITGRPAIHSCCLRHRLARGLMPPTSAAIVAYGYCGSAKFTTQKAFPARLHSLCMQSDMYSMNWTRTLSCISSEPLSLSARQPHPHSSYMPCITAAQEHDVSPGSPLPAGLHLRCPDGTIIAVHVR